MHRIALIANGVAENVILVDDVDSYVAPEGFESREVGDEVSAGDLWDGATFTRAPTPPGYIDLAELIDIGMRLGLVPVDAVVALLPLTKAEVTQDKDGGLVVPVENLDEVITKAVDDGSVPPKDIPPTPEEAGEISVDEPVIP